MQFLGEQNVAITHAILSFFYFFQISTSLLELLKILAIFHLFYCAGVQLKST